MNRKIWLLVGMAMAIVSLALFGIQSRARAGDSAAADAGSLSGMGTLSGTVTAPKDFKAAQVYIKNVDKNVVYMVYTDNGHYRAVNLFPGNYEVSVTKSGFTSNDVQKVKISAGENANADFTLQEGTYRPPQQWRPGQPKNVPLVSFDALYPPGPGRDLAERTCIRCHGPDFLPSKQWNAAAWNAAIDLMESTAPNSNPPGRISPTSVEQGFSQQERDILVAYLVRNFGLDSQIRGLAQEEMPLDEHALGKAEYIEYHLPPLPDAPGQRQLHDEHLSLNGDVWYVDMGALQIGKLDPRTATFKDYPIDVKYRGHGITQAPDGTVWWAGHNGFGRMDPNTGETKFFDYLSKPGERAPHGNTPVVDSKGNIWTTTSWINSIAKLNTKTEEVSLFKAPTPYAFTYGAVMDKNDNMWVAEWFACKIAKFDTKTEKWTEYEPLTRPCTMRRLSVDSKGMIWYALDSVGKIGKFDPTTGKVVGEWNMPMKWGFTYDIKEGHDGNMWIIDSGQGGGIYSFNPQTEVFTYYPAPQHTDMPKLEVSGENSLWYTTRGGDKGTAQAVGVLYPDTSKITTLGGSY